MNKTYRPLAIALTLFALHGLALAQNSPKPANAIPPKTVCEEIALSAKALGAKNGFLCMTHESRKLISIHPRRRATESEIHGSLWGSALAFVNIVGTKTAGWDLLLETSPNQCSGMSDADANILNKAFKGSASASKEFYAAATAKIKPLACDYKTPTRNNLTPAGGQFCSALQAGLPQPHSFKSLGVSCHFNGKTLHILPADKPVQIEFAPATPIALLSAASKALPALPSNMHLRFPLNSLRNPTACFSLPMAAIPSASFSMDQMDFNALVPHDKNLFELPDSKPSLELKSMLLKMHQHPELAWVRPCFGFNGVHRTVSMGIFE